jgi:nucleoside phosphorylase
MAPSRPSNGHYLIAWVCVLEIELTTARNMLDQQYKCPPVEPNEPNSYIYGRIQEHNIVLACLPSGQYGSSSIVRLVSTLRATFPSLQFVLLVGIGGGVPSPAHDIRLGDVVVNLPSNSHGGVVQYDMGSSTQGMTQPVHRTGVMIAPPSILLSAIAMLQANNQRTSEKKIGRFLFEAYRNNTALKSYVKPDEPDELFRSDYRENRTFYYTRSQWDYLVQRHKRDSVDPEVHFGTIASSNHAMKDGVTRDRVSNELGGVLCFEMEAAGIMNSLPCLMVRGICDYADSHRNQDWQRYAAVTAAATAKEILSYVSAQELNQSHAVWYVTELHNAAKQGATDTAQGLLQDGADSNARDSDGCTPLHYAATNGQMEVIKLLFHWQANESITNSSGKSARDIARENGHSDVLSFLDNPPIIVPPTLKVEKAAKKSLQGLPVMEDRCEQACKEFEARIELNSEAGCDRTYGYMPIYDLLYRKDDYQRYRVLRNWNAVTQGKTEKRNEKAMTWVHLPANNVCIHVLFSRSSLLTATQILWAKVGFPFLPICRSNRLY